eukprot:7598818-Pyramimonas_sp.AAC.1
MVVAADPQCLAVKINEPYWKVVVMVCHSLRLEAPHPKRQAWWNEVQQLVTRHGVDILLTDANARVGSVCSSSVGGVAADVEDRNGA